MVALPVSEMLAYASVFPAAAIASCALVAGTPAVLISHRRSLNRTARSSTGRWNSARTRARTVADTGHS